MVFIILIAAAFASPAAAQSQLLSASSREHLWIVREAASDRATHTADLLHHALDMAGPHAAPTVPLHFMPEAMAAYGDRVWVVSPPRSLSAGTARDVLTLQIRKRPEIDLYVPEPEDRFSVLEMLPGDGILVSLVATGGGPLALMRFDRTVHSDSDSTSSGGGGTAAAYRLYEYRGDRWSSSSLPSHVRPGDRVLLAVDGPDLAQLNLLTSSAEDPGSTLLWRRDAQGWSAQPGTLNMDLRSVRKVTQVRGRLAVVIETRGNELELAYLRPGHLLPLTQVPIEHDAAGWVIAGLDDGFRMIVQSTEAEGRLLLRHIHWLTGEIGSEQFVTRPGLPTARLLHMAIMLTIAVVTVVLVLVVRPGAVHVAPAGAAKTMRRGEGGVVEVGVIELPKRTAILSPVSRTVALLVDLAPGGVLALLITRASPFELLRMPIVTNSLDSAAPYLIMIGIMFGHVTLSEMMKGTSLGKALVGGRILSLANDPAGPVTINQALVRNLLKILILMIPPLAIFALLSRNLQGFNDIVAKTIVVGDLPSEESVAPTESDEQ